MRKPLVRGWLLGLGVREGIRQRQVVKVKLEGTTRKMRD